MDTEEKLIISSIIASTPDIFTAKDKEAICMSVNGHLYFLRKDISPLITFTDAGYSWMENIYLPLSISMHRFMSNCESCPKTLLSKIFFGICDNWYFLSLDRVQITPREAAEDYFHHKAQAYRPFLKRRTCSTVA
ncbi:MAG: hypothetical protein LKE40_00755 [Spirochaetia bacterium]|nr:hypothetical protein [Spirochaetia bacterium]